jgi:MtN3 and saliva related transmembrane protein
MNKWYKRYIIFVGVLGQFSQPYLIVKNQSAQDVSLFGFLCGLISASSWLIYGLMVHDQPLILTNAIGVTLVGLTIMATLVYG